MSLHIARLLHALVHTQKVVLNSRVSAHRDMESIIHVPHGASCAHGLRVSTSQLHIQNTGNISYGRVLQVLIDGFNASCYCLGDYRQLCQ
jgi:hypothetical protein